MTVRIYNATDEEYISIADYIDDYDADDEDVYYIHFYYRLATLFAKVQERTAYRGRFARDENGKSMIERYAMTADEEDFFDEKMELGAGQLYRKLMAWTKNMIDSFQWKALHDFGNEEESVLYTGTIAAYGSGASYFISDASASFTVNEYAGKILEITSGVLTGQTATIVSNEADIIVLASGFSINPSGSTYKIYEMVAATESSVQFFMTIQDTPYVDVWEIVEAKIQEALIKHSMKEWYLVSRFMEDYTIENAQYESLLDEIKSSLMMKTEPTRRRLGFWKSY